MVCLKYWEEYTVFSQTSILEVEYDGEMMCQMKNEGQLLHSHKFNENGNDDFSEGY